MKITDLSLYLNKTFKHVELFYFNNETRANEKANELRSQGFKVIKARVDEEIPLLLRTCAVHKINNYLAMGLVAGLIIVVN